MSENRLVNEIRNSRRLRRLWNRCSAEQKRQVLVEAGGDDWNILSVLQSVLESGK